MSRAALLDVNVLVALFDPDHPHHEAAHLWFGRDGRAAWATCPLTENGLVRVLSNPAYSPARLSPGAVVERLRAFCRSGEHEFWPDEVSLLDSRLFRSPGPVGYRSVTDVYLLGLATARGGRLATFDRRILVRSVVGADDGHLELIPA